MHFSYGDDEEISTLFDFEMRGQTFTYSEKDTTRDVTVEFRYPLFTPSSALQGALNTFITQELSKSILYDSPTTLMASAESLICRYKSVASHFDERMFPWEHKSEIRVIYQSPDVISLEQETYAYTGGAHGIHHFSLYTLSKRIGRPLTFKDILGDQDPDTFVDKAENRFRETFSISSFQSLKDAGFWFENNRFHLPENAALLEKGILFIYNPYEIAPYSEGVLRFIVPLESMQLEE